jgi:hypothetical protein
MKAVVLDPHAPLQLPHCPDPLLLLPPGPRPLPASALRLAEASLRRYPRGDPSHARERPLYRNSRPPRRY